MYTFTNREEFWWWKFSALPESVLLKIDLIGGQLNNASSLKKNFEQNNTEDLLANNTKQYPFGNNRVIELQA